MEITAIVCGWFNVLSLFQHSRRVVRLLEIVHPSVTPPFRMELSTRVLLVLVAVALCTDPRGWCLSFQISNCESAKIFTPVTAKTISV